MNVEPNPLKVWMEVRVQCPTCRQGPTIQDLNEKLGYGAGVLGCGNCGNVANLTAWLVLPSSAKQ